MKGIADVKQHVEAGKTALMEAQTQAEAGKDSLEQADISQLGQALGEMIAKLEGLRSSPDGALAAAGNHVENVHRQTSEAGSSFVSAFGFRGEETDNADARGMMTCAGQGNSSATLQHRAVQGMGGRVGEALMVLRAGKQYLDGYEEIRQQALVQSDEEIAHTAAGVEHADAYLAQH